MRATAKIAKLLRTEEEVILNLEKKMEDLTGKKGVIDEVREQNDRRVREKLKELGLKKDSSIEKVHEALVEKVKVNDEALSKLFRKPNFKVKEDCQTLLNFSREAANPPKGFFLSLKKARELLESNPPKNIIKIFGSKDIKGLLAKEDVLEVFCALRFAEDPHWLNDIFFRPYKNLKEDDFEEREIEARVLSSHWLGVGRKFIGKKLHNISHLKELGIIYIIPLEETYPGQVIESFTLLIHYFHEIDFYSRLFRKYAKKSDFGAKLVKALQGVVLGKLPPEENGINWLIVQRYLAKDDPNDPRLFKPHVNPEALHYLKVSRDLEIFGQRFPELGLDFWKGLGTVGEFFSTGSNSEKVLLSFDLFDSAISLTKEMGALSKYLYHQQEALWNKIFAAYLGEIEMENLMLDNLDKGIIKAEGRE